MEFTNLKASSRELGKSKTRSIRLSGNVPCVLYGNNVEPISFQLPAAHLRQLVRAQETPLVAIDFEGKSWNCILKDVDYHPVTDEPVHADFQVLKDGEKIGITVPFRFSGTPVGQIQGGNTQYVLSDADITCLPKDIPPYFEVDITNLGIGEAVHIGDLAFDGVEFSASANQTVVMIHAPRISGKTAAEEEGAEAEAEEEG